MIPSLSVLANTRVTGGGGGGGGGGGVSASITSRTVSDFTVGEAAFASYTLNLNGNVYDQDSTNLEAWLDSGANTDFECRASGVTGDTPTGTLNTWQALTASRTWSLTANVGLEKSSTFTLEIRNAATLAVLTTASITIHVIAETS